MLINRRQGRSGKRSVTSTLNQGQRLSNGELVQITQDANTPAGRIFNSPECSLNLLRIADVRGLLERPVTGYSWSEVTTSPRSAADHHVDDSEIRRPWNPSPAGTTCAVSGPEYVNVTWDHQDGLIQGHPGSKAEHAQRKCRAPTATSGHAPFSGQPSASGLDVQGVPFCVSHG